MCLRDAIPIMNLVKEISSRLNLGSHGPIIKYKLFEDNESCIKIAKAPILTTRTKYVSLEYRHFRSHVEDSSVSIEAIRTGEHNTGILTKPVGETQFSYLIKVQRTLILRGSIGN